MSTHDESSHDYSDIYVPCDTEDLKLIWDGNYAKILGLLVEVQRYLRRVGLLQAWIRHRAVLVKEKTVVAHLHVIPFVKGQILDGEAVASGIAFASDKVQHVDELHLFNFDAGTVWWDDIVLAL